MFFYVGMIFIIGFSIVMGVTTGDWLQSFYVLLLPFILLLAITTATNYERIFLKSNYYVHRSIWGTKKIYYTEIIALKMETVTKGNSNYQKYRYINVYNHSSDLLDQFSNAFFTDKQQRKAFLHKLIQGNPGINLDLTITKQPNIKPRWNLFPVLLVIFIILMISVGIFLG